MTMDDGERAERNRKRREAYAYGFNALGTFFSFGFFEAVLIFAVASWLGKLNL